MKKLLLFAGALIPAIFYAQNLKQYTGEFDDGTSSPGKASYSYFTRDDERIKQGLFSYLRNVKSNEGSFKCSISGNFKNNQKDGIWNQTISFVDWDNGTGNCITGTISLSSNYREGLPNGQWVYSESSKSRIKKYSVSGYYWSSYTEPTASKAIISFKNGILTGNFQMENFLDADNMKATFDQGFCIGNLLFSPFPTFREETRIDYSGHIMIKEVERDKSTGEVIKKSDITPDDIVLLQKFSEGKINQQTLQNNHLKVDTIKLIKLDDFQSNIYNPFFLNEYLKGDKVFDGSFDFGGYHLYTTKYEIISLAQSSDMKSEMERVNSYMADTTNIPHLKFAMELLGNIKSNYKNNLLSNDLEKIENYLSVCQKNIDMASINEKNQKSELDTIYNFDPRGKDTIVIRAALNRALNYQRKYKLSYHDQDIIDNQIAICKETLRQKSTPPPIKHDDDMFITNPSKNVYGK